MKSSLPKQLALVLLLALSATGSGMAHGGHPAHHEGRPTHGEVQAYYQANVLPVLQQQRQKLELQLSADDRAQLATYRTQLRTLHEQTDVLLRGFNAGYKAYQPGLRPELTESQRNQLQQLHQLQAQSRAIRASVGQLAQKYRENLSQLGQALQPQQEKWSAEMQAIVLKNATPEQKQRMAALSSQLPEHGHLHMPGRRHFFRPVNFLLMEPTATPTASTPEHNLSSTSFYPNPVTATTQFEYELKAAGPVTVELLDQDGNKLRTAVAETNAEKGAHAQQLNLSDLPAGTYYYKVTTTGDSQTKRFVKE